MSKKRDRGDIQEHLESMDQAELKARFHRFNMTACSMVLKECTKCEKWKPCDCDFESWRKWVTWEIFDGLEERKERNYIVIPPKKCEKCQFLITNHSAKFCCECGNKLGN